MPLRTKIGLTLNAIKITKLHLRSPSLTPMHELQHLKDYRIKQKDNQIFIINHFVSYRIRNQQILSKYSLKQLLIIYIQIFAPLKQMLVT